MARLGSVAPKRSCHVYTAHLDLPESFFLSFPDALLFFLLPPRSESEDDDDEEDEEDEEEERERRPRDDDPGGGILTVLALKSFILRCLNLKI